MEPVPDDDWRRTLREDFRLDQLDAQLRQRWPEYVAGNTTHFTDADWRLVRWAEEDMAAERHRQWRLRLLFYVVMMIGIGAALILLPWAITNAS